MAFERSRGEDPMVFLPRKAKAGLGSSQARTDGRRTLAIELLVIDLHTCADQDIRESGCESCGEIAGDGASIECREWHYRGSVYPSAPVPLMLEAIMRSMLEIDAIPHIEPEPLAELPPNLVRFFSGVTGRSCCP
ncbi:MAG TPA: DUF2703 domain-containing protein [Rectinemataceae bacterium]